MAEFSERAKLMYVGTVGAPGEREFFLQILFGKRIISLAFEKGQASALAEKILQIAKDLGLNTRRESIAVPPLEMPIDPEFSIGVISISWIPNERTLQFSIEAITDESDLSEAANVKFEYPIEESIYFALGALQIVASGRQPCLFCGGPINVDGHLCPRANGYRRQS